MHMHSYKQKQKKKKTFFYYSVRKLHKNCILTWQMECFQSDQPFIFFPQLLSEHEMRWRLPTIASTNNIPHNLPVCYSSRVCSRKLTLRCHLSLTTNVKKPPAATEQLLPQHGCLYLEQQLCWRYFIMCLCMFFCLFWQLAVVKLKLHLEKTDK